MLVLRVLRSILGIVVAAVGGVMAYRAAFVESPAAVVVTDAGKVSEVPDVWRIVAGLALLVAGIAVALSSARRRT